MTNLILIGVVGFVIIGVVVGVAAWLLAPAKPKQDDDNTTTKTPDRAEPAADGHQELAADHGHKPKDLVKIPALDERDARIAQLELEKLELLDEIAKLKQKAPAPFVTKAPDEPVPTPPAAPATEQVEPAPKKKVAIPHVE